MASFTIGTGGDYITLEAAATDPTANQAGNTWTIVSTVSPVANVATINAGVIIIGNGHIVDCSAIVSGICIDGGQWQKAIIKRIATTAATLIANATLTSCTVDTPLQDGALVNCTGDTVAVKNKTGAVGGIVDVGGDSVVFVGEGDVLSAWTGDKPALWVSNGMTAGIRVPATTAITFKVSPSRDSGWAYIADGREERGVIIAKSSTGAWYNPDQFDKPYNPTVTQEYTYTAISEGVITRIGSGDAGGAAETWEGILHSFRVDGIADYVFEFGASHLVDSIGSHDTLVGGNTWVLTTDYTPKIGGSLLLPSGTYAGAVQPKTGARSYSYHYSYEY